jgi:hypothetical protein
MSAPARYTSVGARIRDLEAVNADLLAALEEAVNDIVELCGRLEAEGRDTGDFEIGLADYRAAIKKARG